MRFGIAILTVILLTAFLMNCHGIHDGYKDLSTGEEVKIDKDAETGHIIDKNTGKPLYILVDVLEDDTIYAKTGEVINGHVINRDNKFVYDKDAKDSVAENTAMDENEKLKISDSGAVKYKDGDFKTKVKKNGDIKIKDGDRKVTIDGKTGKEVIKKK